MTAVRLQRSPPCVESLERYAIRAGVGVRPFNHGFYPGGPHERDGSHDLRTIHLTVELGHGRSDFLRAQKLLMDWRMHDASATTGVWQRDGMLVTWARMLPGVWVLNPCRTLSWPRQGTRRSTAVGYATTRGHLIAGCEIMTVRLAHDGVVSFETLSRSRGAGPVGRAIFGLLAPAQHRFFAEQCRCMRALMSDEA